MISPITIGVILVAYIIFLVLIAFYAERKGSNSKLFNSKHIYALSLAGYCTTWTYYGSVGSAAKSGLLFLTIYLGPTLMILLWWYVLKKLIRIKKKYNITSIVDFISTRYDKSLGIGVFLSIFILLSIIPYIALQLKAILKTFTTISGIETFGTTTGDGIGITAIIILTLFTILFGIRKLDPNERHPGIVLVLAVECVIKLVAFLVVGLFVCYGLFSGYWEVIDQMAVVVDNSYSFMGNNEGSLLKWMTYLVLSGSAIIFLPRQFHLAVIENNKEKHINTAIWMLPLYMFLINLFVLPIAIAGLSYGIDVSKADQYVLLLPLINGQKLLSIFAFIGGFSAGMGMIIISTMAVTTIVSNHLVLPLSKGTFLERLITKHLLQVRWIIAFALTFSSYVYLKIVGENYALVSIGIISFAGVLQLAPPILGSLIWSKGNRKATIVSLVTGFGLWFYTLYLPAFIKSGWGPMSLLESGPFGISFLRPEHLLGMTGVSNLTHSVFWSLFFNISSYIFISLITKRNSTETEIARSFYRPEREAHEMVVNLEDKDDLKSDIYLDNKIHIINDLLYKFYSKKEVSKDIKTILLVCNPDKKESINIVQLSLLKEEVERLLAGSIGTALASRYVKESGLMSKVEKDQLYEYYSASLAELNVSPIQLQKKVELYKEKQKLVEDEVEKLENVIKIKTKEIQDKNNELLVSIEANKKMQEQLIAKEKQASLGIFSAGIAHEIKNPLNHIINSAVLIETILKDFDLEDPDEEDLEDLKKLAGITVKHGKKANEIIKTFNRTTDTSKISFEELNLKEELLRAIETAKVKFNSTEFTNCPITFEFKDDFKFVGCKESLQNVFVNIIDNALDASVSSNNHSEITISASKNSQEEVHINVFDNGIGIEKESLKEVFTPLYTTKETDKGTGLGLSICQDIITQHHGEIKIESMKDQYTMVSIVIPKLSAS